MNREPLDPARLSTLAAPWTVTVLEATGSTNADAAEAARQGAAEGTAVLAEQQTAGRGRLGRTWTSPARAGLAMSVVLRPRVETARWGWLPLVAGLALADTVADVAGLDARLKWPNDLLVDGRKAAGILAEVPVPGVVVLGVGLNVSLAEDELPVTAGGLPATSLLLAGAAPVDRTALAAALLHAVRREYERWQEAAGDAVASGVHADYLVRCATVGRQVRVGLPDGGVTGVAETVDGEGRLVVRDPSGARRAVAAGDVVHLR